MHIYYEFTVLKKTNTNDLQISSCLVLFLILLYLKISKKYNQICYHCITIFFSLIKRNLLWYFFNCANNKKKLNQSSAVLKMEKQSSVILYCEKNCQISFKKLLKRKILIQTVISIMMFQFYIINNQTYTTIHKKPTMSWI